MNSLRYNVIIIITKAVLGERRIIHGLIVELFSYRFCDIVKPVVRITNGAFMIVTVTVLSVPLALLLKKICHIFDKKEKE